MTNETTPTRYPGYDVLDKRDSPSWDAITLTVVEERLATPTQPRFLDGAQWATLSALCDRVVAPSQDSPAIPVAALLDARLLLDQGDGWRNARMPTLRKAWCVGLAALDAESQSDHSVTFVLLTADQQTDLIKRMQHGELTNAAWQGMPSDMFFSERVLHDLFGAYYSHPASWSEIGFGGPANPRGYVRLNKNRRDPWEAVEAPAGSTAEHRDLVRRENSHVR